MSLSAALLTLPFRLHGQYIKNWIVGHLHFIFLWKSIIIAWLWVTFSPFSFRAICSLFWPSIPTLLFAFLFSEFPLVYTDKSKHRASSRSSQVLVGASQSLVFSRLYLSFCHPLDWCCPCFQHGSEKTEKLAGDCFYVSFCFFSPFFQTPVLIFQLSRKAAFPS